MGLINTAISGLRASQMALSTTGHNITNADTDGYTRQSVETSTASSTRTGVGFVGNGVRVDDIVRNTEQHLLDQVNRDTAVLSELDSYLSNITKLDNLFAGDETNLAKSVEQFFNAVNEASNDPSSLLGRELLMTESETLVSSFKDVENRLREHGETINQQLGEAASTVTTIGGQIAELNRSISFATSSETGKQPNDLLDKRDQLLRDLSEQVDVSTVDRNDGMIDVTIGQGQPLVTGQQARELVTVPSDSDSGRNELAFVGGSGRPEKASGLISGGELGALQRFREEALDPSVNALGRVALAVTGQFNEQHKQGMDLEGSLGGNVFTDINDPALAARRIQENSGNSPSGDRQMSVRVEDLSQLTTSNYELSFSGPSGRYSLTRLSDGEVVDQGMLTDKRPQTISADGLEIDIQQGSFSQGDRFRIEPTRFAASGMETEIKRPEAFALASPIRTSASDGNRGGAHVSAGEVSSVDTPAFGEDGKLSPPVMIRFTSSNTYDVLDYSDPGNPKPLEPPLMNQQFTPGSEIDVFPGDPGGSTVSSEGPAAGALQPDQSTNGFPGETLSIQHTDPETGAISQQTHDISADQSADEIAAELSALDGVSANASSRMVLNNFQSGASGDPLEVSLNGVDLTDPSFVPEGATEPETVPDPLTADFLRDRINASETLDAQGIFARSDGENLTVRSTTGVDLNVTVAGTDGSLSVENPSGTAQDLGPALAEDEVTMGGRLDVQLGSDTTLRSDEPTGLFGTQPDHVDNYTGYQVTLGSGSGEGAPRAGDQFLVGYNSSGSADNRNAASLLDLSSEKSLGGGNLDYQGAYGQMVEELGIKTSETRQSQSASESVLRQSMDALQSVSGVNVEEEAARLIQLEQHYNASARLIALSRDLFDTLMNM